MDNSERINYDDIKTMYLGIYPIKVSYRKGFCSKDCPYLKVINSSKQHCIFYNKDIETFVRLKQCIWKESEKPVLCVTGSESKFFKEFCVIIFIGIILYLFISNPLIFIIAFLTFNFGYQNFKDYMKLLLNYFNCNYSIKTYIRKKLKDFISEE